VPRIILGEKEIVRPHAENPEKSFKKPQPDTAAEFLAE
jgi:hypothetical protein